MTDIISAQNFDTFVNIELKRAMESFDQEQTAVYMYCHLGELHEPSRRVLVVTEANCARIAVCIEATYQLFEGDIHHYVRQVGTVNRSEAAQKLEPLVREAYQIIMAWKSNLDNIGVNAFLPY